ncbi:MAG: ABC transporter ATP-binding protein [Hyphomicrobiales bacterium]|nr:ABC transporter ATP-binding protein [Hyphomicrobiales bacterium]
MQGKEIRLQGVSMRFGDFIAVHETDLTIAAGEFFSILGPSGCGKTTILRMISGFLTPTTGQVLIGGKDLTAVGPNKRPTALIFQNLALFPLMSVWENVAFGLEARGIGRRERRKRAEDLLDLVALTEHAGKKPTALSGGQRQRVAIARALAVEPSVLLLDEPLSALDLKLRQHMRAELKQIQRKTGVTFVYITHDQGEALTMSDRIAVMNAGRIEQVAPTSEIYNAPATSFVATFVGEHNVFRGRVEGLENGMAQVNTPLGRLLGMNRDDLKPGEEAMIFVRPERIGLVSQTPTLGNRLQAAVERRDLEGPYLNVFMRAGEHQIVMHMTNAGNNVSDLSGEQSVGFACEDALVLRAGELAGE